MDVPYTRKERNAQHRQAEALIQEQRNSAIMAARQEREAQTERMAAQVDPAQPARTPVPKAERPEPTPFEKFAGYNDRLDPCSPNFSLDSWGGE